MLKIDTPAKLVIASRLNGASARLSSMRLAGAGGELKLQGTVRWPVEGQFELGVRGVRSGLIDDFLAKPLPPVLIDSLRSIGTWTNGPVSGEVEFTALVLTNPMLTAELKLRADQRGISVPELVVNSLSTNTVRAHGFLPLRVNPGRPEGVLELKKDVPLDLHFSAGSEGPLWPLLQQQTGLELKRPKADLDVVGTWDSLSGQFKIAVEAVSLTGTNAKLPRIENIEVTGELDRGRARVLSSRLLVQGQPVMITGELPLPASFWTNPGTLKIPQWQQASARLRVEEADVAPLATFYPQFLTPQGELTTDLSLAPGGRLEGFVRLEGARTRPISGLPPFRDINFELQFKDRSAVLQKAGATLGGTPVSVRGTANLGGTNWLRGQLPPFEISLHGTNVPLSRQPDSVIRSDLDISIAKSGGEPPSISGVARLRDSYYLSDLASLVPGKVATPSRRPPYFSIDDPFFRDWRLGVRVEGLRFLNVKSPIFAGRVSLTMQLQGTLKDPLALGDARIDSGVVRFPFAVFAVQQGFITLTSQDPYHPRLSLSAASRQYGYDIKMDVSGPVDAPVIGFVSTPPLSSEQLLLMVTAGELPREDHSLSTQQRAQTFALFLGRDLLVKLGFADQGEQRLTIRSGEEFSEQGRPTYNVEYKLTDRWSLTGEYDRFNAYNAGFKWRVYSK